MRIADQASLERDVAPENVLERIEVSEGAVRRAD
jgi:hypothetical protein